MKRWIKPLNPLLLIDGLGRAVRTAKIGFVNGTDDWNVSGAVEYDDEGRIKKEGMTEFINGDLEELLPSTPEMGNSGKVVTSKGGDDSHLHLGYDGDKDGRFRSNTSLDNPARLLYSEGY